MRVLCWQSLQVDLATVDVDLPGFAEEDVKGVGFDQVVPAFEIYCIKDKLWSVVGDLEHKDVHVLLLPEETGRLNGHFLVVEASGNHADEPGNLLAEAGEFVLDELVVDFEADSVSNLNLKLDTTVKLLKKFAVEQALRSV